MQRPYDSQEGHDDRANGKRQRNIFSTYLDDAGSFDLLDADEERSIARHVAELRLDYWRATFSCPSMLIALLDDLRSETDAKKVPTDEIERAREAALALAKSPDHQHADALSEAIDTLSKAMTAADPEAAWADRVAKALEDQLRDREQPLEGAFSACSSDKSFRSYRRRVLDARRHYVQARNNFVCANLRLVVKVAQRYGRNRMSLADRVQEGNFGLLKAVERFDPDRGVRFSTYAGWWIRHAVTRALVNRGRTVRIPAHLHTIFTKVRRARLSLRGELGRDPSLKEIAASINVPLDKVEIAVDAMELRSVGLDAPLAGDGTPSVADTLEDHQPAELTARIDDGCDLGLARQAIEHLDDMEADIIKHRFGIGGAQRVTLQALGDKYKLSRERIRQLQNRALAKLREVVDNSPVPSLAIAT